MSDSVSLPGATIGRDVVKELFGKRSPPRISASVRDQAKARENNSGQTLRLRHSILKTQHHSPGAREGVEKVFLLPPLLMPNQVEATMHLSMQRKRTGVRHIVSTLRDGRRHRAAVFALGEMARGGEQHIRESGPRSHFSDRFRSCKNCFINRFPPRDEQRSDLPWRNGKAAFVDTRDIAAVAFEVLTQNGHQGRDLYVDRTSHARDRGGGEDSVRRSATRDQICRCPGSDRARTECCKLACRNGR